MLDTMLHGYALAGVMTRATLKHQSCRIKTGHMSKFEPGTSGNPQGRPKGTGQAARLRQAIAGDLDDIISALVKQAKGGDVSAAKLLLDKCVPSVKPVEAPVTVHGLTEGTKTERADRLLALVESGEISADQYTVVGCSTRS